MSLFVPLGSRPFRDAPSWSRPYGMMGACRCLARPADLARTADHAGPGGILGTASIPGPGAWRAA